MSEFTAAEVADALTYGAKTSKRVTWEAWSLRIVGSREVEVTNESYGFEKVEHRYVVMVAERDGVFVPVECECPADQYNEEYACKHRVAVATVGGPVVLGAAMAYTPDESGPPLCADGGLVEVRGDTEERPVGCDCWNPDQGLPCWSCFRDWFERPNPKAEAEE